MRKTKKIMMLVVTAALLFSFGGVERILLPKKREAKAYR